MKKLLIIPILLICLVTSAATYYVSPSGSNSNPGTLAQPFLTIQYGIDRLTSPGDILYVRGGTYTPSATSGGGWYNAVYISSARNGTSGNTIKVYNYPGEVVTIDGSNLTENGVHCGININGASYWDFKGINVRNVTEYGSGSQYGIGWQTVGTNNILIEQCSVYNTAGGFFDNYSTGLRYINCDSYNNADLHDAGDFANGFTVHTHGANTVLFEGCRAWANCDDGYDFYGSSGYITLNRCWAFGNGPGNAYNGYKNGNGSGIKTGANDTQIESGVQRTVTNCLAWGNTGAGFDKSQDNGPAMLHNLYNNISYNNTVAFNFQRSGTNDIVRNNIAFANANFYPISTGFTIDHNTFTSSSQNGVIAVTNADFLSISASGTDGARQADGSLPNLNFLKLSSNSVLKDKGVNVGIPFGGSAPDLGPYESQLTSTTTIPLYVSSSVENSTPTLLQISYNITLANVVPAVSAFSVIVNSVPRSVNSVAISGSKVQLTLASAIKYGDIITVSYIKPASNPLKSESGGESISFSAQSTTNNLTNSVKDTTPATISMIISPNPVHKIINIAFQYTSTALAPQIIRIFDISGKLFIEKLLTTGVASVRFSINLNSGVYNVLLFSGGLQIASQKIIVHK